MFAHRSLSLLEDRLYLAVKRDDLHKFKSLLASDEDLLNWKSDREGDSLLNLAIFCESWKIFNYLLSLDFDNTLINKTNVRDRYPLDIAMNLQLKRFVAKLIEKGSYIGTTGSSYSPLHTAIKREWFDISDALIERGVDVDALNCFSEQSQTSLHIACRRRFTDDVFKLLFYGADPFINDKTNWSPADEMAISDDKQLQEFFLNKLLPHCEALHVDVFSHMMVKNSPIFVTLLNRIDKIKTCDHAYTYFNSFCFIENIAYFNPEFFRMFVDKFTYVIKQAFTYYKKLIYWEYTFPSHVDCLSKDSVLDRYLENLSCVLNVVSYLPRPDGLRKRVSYSEISSYLSVCADGYWTEDDIHKIICVLLTNGINPSSTDLDTIYKRFGYCELFKTMLHMDIEDVSLKKQNILPRLFYDMDVTIEKYLDYPQLYHETDADYRNNLLALCNFSALPKTMRHRGSISDDEELALRIEKLPDVPFLVELARNTIRDHIINKLQIRSSKQFYTVIKHLPIAEAHKQIIAFEKEIYSV